MHLVQRELQSFKTILGPWYHSQVQSTSRGDVRHVHVPEDSNLQGFAGPSHSRTVSQRTQGPTSPDPFDNLDAEHDTATSFFLPPEALLDSRIHAHSRTSSSLLDIQSHPGQRSLPLAPVAPLNLSTSLEGSLVGLRDSITAVAASVDSLARRNDIALTNENMRLNEELGSLKYAVHGIRLQVCLCSTKHCIFRVVVKPAGSLSISIFFFFFSMDLFTLAYLALISTAPEQLHRLMMDRNAQVTGRLGETSSARTVPVPIPVPVPPTQPIFHPPIMTPPFPPAPGTKL